MSRQQIEDLHGRASEHYLKGEFREALQAWKDVLTLDPGDEQALEGVRLSGLLLEGTEETNAKTQEVLPAPPREPAVGAEVGGETLLLDPELLESIVHAPAAASPRPPVAERSTAELHPDRQGGGLDFGSLEELDAIPVGFDREIALPKQGGHAPDRAPAASPSRTTQSATAAAELNRRVDDLLEEARSLHAQKRDNEALGVLSRLSILDEENAAAGELETEIRTAMERMVSKVDGWIAEGVQAFDRGRTQEARGFFERVLEFSPEHREALHYIEAIRSAGTGAPAPSAESTLDDLLSGITAPKDAGHVAPRAGAEVDESAPTVPLARPSPARASRSSSSHATKAGTSAPAMPALARARSGSRWLLVAVAGGLLMIGAAAYWWTSRRSGGGAESVAAQNTTPVKRPAAKAPPQDASGGGPRAGAASAARTLPELLSRGQAALEAQEYGDAVIAYNAAVQLDPQSVAAKEGLARATEGYKARKAEQEQLQSVRMAFAGEEFTSALHILYRLPKSLDKARIDRYKANGWYNLGVVALRGGECPQALSHFDEALSLRGSDDGVRQLRAFAERYRDVAKDRAFYDTVEQLSFRKLDD